jgi:D-alanyl-D-alanine carboxypeptidase
MNILGKNKKIILLIILLIVVVGVVFFVYYNGNKQNILPDESNNITNNSPEDYFEHVSLEAKSAFVWDAKEGRVLFSLNEEAQLPLASLTKMMTALVVYNLVPSKTIITINESDIEIEGDSGLSVGEKWTLSNALDFILLTSSNDGAHALASVIGFIKQDKEKTAKELFIEEMNKKAQEIGLTQTYFLNESGLDFNEKISGAYGSTKDMAFLMDNIIKNNARIIEATRYSNLTINSKKVEHLAENTNYYAESIPGIIGSKTGFTDLAGGNLVIAFDVGIGHPVIVSVLGSSREGRFTDVNKLVEATINKFKK